MAAIDFQSLLAQPTTGRVPIDWHVVQSIASSILLLFVGAVVNRWFERKPKLVSFVGHVGVFSAKLADGTTGLVHTHVVTLKNAGRKTANNVRLLHHSLPKFSISPSLSHSVNPLPDGSEEIVIPALVAGEVVTISYTILCSRS